MQNDAIAELVNANNWHLRKTQDNGAIPNDQAIRYIPGVRMEDFDALMAYLAANPTHVGLSVSQNSQDRDGTWTHVLCWVEDLEGEPALFELLQKGVGLTTAWLDSGEDCRYDVDRKYYVDVLTLPALPANDEDAGITYRMGQVSYDRESARRTAYVEKRTRLYQKIDAYESDVQHGAVNVRSEHLGVKTGDVTASGTSGSAVGLQSMTVDQGIRKRRARSRNADCTQDIVEDSTTSKPLSATAMRDATGFTEQSLRSKNSRTQHAADEQAQGIVSVATNDENDDGTYDGQKQSVTSHPLSATGGKAATGFTEASQRVKNNLTELTPTAAAQGVIGIASNEKNDDGTYNGQKQTVSSIALSAAYAYRRRGLTVSGTAYRNARSIAAVPSGTVYGGVRSVAVQDDDTYNYSKEELTYDSIIPATEHWDNYTTPENDFVIWMFRRYSSTNWRRSVTVGFQSKFDTSATAVQSFVDGGIKGLPYCNSEVRIYRQDRFQGVKYTLKSWGAWVEDEPS